MKTRNGFVSNSSSSSFVVQRYDRHTKGSPKLTTTAQDRLLKKNGFRLAVAFFPDQVDYPPVVTDPGPKERKLANWVRYVSCNQEDEILMLLTHRISFDADIHYGHRSMSYDGKTDMLIISQNFGKQIQMYGTEKMNFSSKAEKKPVERTTGADYIKKYKAQWALLA